MADHEIAPLITFPKERPVSVRYPSHMKLLELGLTRNSQVRAEPYETAWHLADQLQRQQIIFTDSIDLVLSSELSRGGSLFVLIRSQKEHLEGRLPDRVLVVVGDQKEALSYFQRQLDPRGFGLFLSRIYDNIFKQRCKQHAKAFGANMVQDFSSPEEIDKLIQNNPPGRIIAVVPYQSFPPLPNNYEEVVYAGSSQIDEETFLKEILLPRNTSMLETSVLLPASHTDKVKTIEEVSRLPSAVFPQPIFIGGIHENPALVAPERIPSPVVSVSSRELQPIKFKIVDLDPLSCIRLQLFCSKGGHRFSRADTYRDVYREIVDREPDEHVLLIVSRDCFQLVRELNDLVKRVTIVIVYGHDNLLTESELKFKQDFHVNVLVSDKNDLVDILSNTPGMIFSKIPPIVTQITGNRGVADSVVYEQFNNGELPKEYKSNSVSLVEVFDPDNPYRRNIQMHNTHALALQNSQLEIGKSLEQKQIRSHQREMIQANVKVSDINSSDYPEIFTEDPRHPVADHVQQHNSSTDEFLPPLIPEDNRNHEPLAGGGLEAAAMDQSVRHLQSVGTTVPLEFGTTQLQSIAVPQNGKAGVEQVDPLPTDQPSSTIPIAPTHLTSLHQAHTVQSIESGLTDFQTSPEISPIIDKSFVDSEREPIIIPQPIQLSEEVPTHSHDTEKPLVVEQPTQPTLDQINPVINAPPSEPSIQLATIQPPIVHAPVSSVTQIQDTLPATVIEHIPTVQLKQDIVDFALPSVDPEPHRIEYSTPSKMQLQEQPVQTLEPTKLKLQPVNSTSLEEIIAANSGRQLIPETNHCHSQGFQKYLKRNLPQTYGKKLQNLSSKILPFQAPLPPPQVANVVAPMLSQILAYNRLSPQPTLTLIHKDLVGQPFIRNQTGDMMIFESLGELLFIINKESKVPNAIISVRTIHSHEYHFMPSLPNVNFIRYVVGHSNSLERTRARSPLFQRKGSLSRDRDLQPPTTLKKLSSNPSLEYQTTLNHSLNPETKRSFVKRMFNKELVYILCEDRKVSLAARIDGVRSFNTRLRVETYNRNNVLQIAMSLVHDHSLVIVATEEETMEHLRSFLLTYNVPLLYCGPNTEQLVVPPESNIYLLSTKRQVLQMIASIPRFFSASSNSKTTVRSVLDHQVIHLYFESAVSEACKREIIELAEQESRRIVPHEIQNHHEIECLSNNMKNEMFVCIVKSQDMYEALLKKAAPNLLVYWTQTEMEGLGQLFMELRTLISGRTAKKKRNHHTDKDQQPAGEYYISGSQDLRKRLINVQFKKLFKSEDSSGISNRSGEDRPETPQQAAPTPEFQTPAIEPLPQSNIIERFHPPRYNLSKLDSLADSTGNIQLLVDRNNHELKEMLIGMPGVNSQEYLNIHSMQSIFEMYRQPLLVVVSDRAVLRHVSQLKRMYPFTEYAVVLNMVDTESEISENARRFRKPKLNEYLKDALFAVETNRRLAILLAAKAQIQRKKLNLRASTLTATLSANYARLCIFHRQPKDEYIVSCLRDRILRPIIGACMFLGYQSPNDILDSLQTLDHLNQHILCLVLERDDDIPNIEACLSSAYKNLHVRFIRIFSKSFKGYAALQDHPGVLTEDDSENNILRFIEEFLVGTSAATSDPAFSKSHHSIQMITSHQTIMEAAEFIEVTKSASSSKLGNFKKQKSQKDQSIIDFNASESKPLLPTSQPSEKHQVLIQANPYDLPIPDDYQLSSSQQRIETEHRSSLKVGANAMNSRKSMSRKGDQNAPNTKSYKGLVKTTSVKQLVNNSSSNVDESCTESSQFVPSLHSYHPSKKTIKTLQSVVSSPLKRPRARFAKPRARSECRETFGAFD